MEPIDDLYERVVELIGRIRVEERESIGKAARVLAKAIAEDRLVHVVGTGGHSYIGAEEFFDRAGGLVPVDPVFEPSLSLSFGALRSTALERIPGLMQRVLSRYDLSPGDPLVIVNSYGINSATIDSALTGREKGLTVIAITSREFQGRVPRDHPARHPTKMNLAEVADIVIDTKVPYEDAVVSVQGAQDKTCAVSTILNAFAIQSLVGQTVKELVSLGVRPPIWVSANVPGGDERNAYWEQKYRSRLRFI
ncbi:MAG: sugar isomerase domain-containing protein [Thermoprotei archaeon]|jgi:uncharacterized phosphosugar-binding protein